MLDCYIHQIGKINDEKTYKTLLSILYNKMIASREYLKNNLGIIIKDEERPFDGKIPKNEFYYDTAEKHKDVVSLSDSNDRLVKKSIEKKSHAAWTCFDYDNIAIGISKEIVTLTISPEDLKYLVPGEVQVRDKIDSEYFIGLLLPISKEQLQDKTYCEIVDIIAKMCEEYLPLNIYNYDGELLKEKTNKKTK